jgi:hypothetical protein
MFRSPSPPPPWPSFWPPALSRTLRLICDSVSTLCAGTIHNTLMRAAQAAAADDLRRCVTCNGQHAAETMHQTTREWTTCRSKHAADDIQRTTCSRQRAADNVQHDRHEPKAHQSFLFARRFGLRNRCGNTWRRRLRLQEFTSAPALLWQ